MSLHPSSDVHAIANMDIAFAFSRYNLMCFAQGMQIYSEVETAEDIEIGARLAGHGWKPVVLCQKLATGDVRATNL